MVAGFVFCDFFNCFCLSGCFAVGQEKQGNKQLKTYIYGVFLNIFCIFAPDY